MMNQRHLLIYIGTPAASHESIDGADSPVEADGGGAMGWRRGEREESPGSTHHWMRQRHVDDRHTGDVCGDFMLTSGLS